MSSESNGKKIHPLFESSQGIGEQIRRVENRLNCSSLSPQKCNKLIKELELMRTAMKKLRTQSCSVDEYAKAQLASSLDLFEEKIITFYGKIHTLSLRFEVKELKKRAVQIQKSVGKKTSVELTANANQLEKEIDQLCSDHTFSREDRVTIGAARAALSSVRWELSSKPSQRRMQKLVLSPQSDSPPDLDLICELFETARKFHRNLFAEGKQMISSLPHEAKKIFHSHLLYLGINEEDLDQHTLKAKQALIATAYQLGGCEDSPHYPTAKQIEQMFDDVEEIIQRDYFIREA